MPYVVPLDEIRFSLAAIAGVDVAGVDMVLEEAARFAEGAFAPLYAVGDEQGCRFADGRVRLPAGFPEAYRACVESGWPALQHPVRLGGQGLPVSVAVAVAEMFNGANLALSMSMMPLGGAVALIDRYGTPAQRTKYLPRIVSGHWTVTMAMTEPQAGSDLGAIRTSAARDGDGGYRVKGQKVLITFGEHEMTENIVHLVLARSPDGPAGAKGLSLYMVTKEKTDDQGRPIGRNDVRCVGIERKMGLRGSPTTTLAFGEQEGAQGELLGKENCGLEQMFVLLNRARLNVAVFGLGSAERARQAALAYARERVQGRDESGKRTAIIGHPDVHRMLMHMTCIAEACRALAYYTASVMDQLETADAEQQQELRSGLELLTPIAKGWCTEQAFTATSLGVQVFGGMGYIEECEASQCFRDARVHTLYEGTTAIQANDLLFRKVVRDHGRAASWLLSQVVADLDGFQGADLGSARDILAEGVAAAKSATEHVLASAASEGARMRTQAVHYLMLMGAITAGWLLLRAAAKVEQSGSYTEGFIARKTGAALFFMEQVLRPATSLAPTFQAGVGSFDPDYAAAANSAPGAVGSPG